MSDNDSPMSRRVKLVYLTKFMLYVAVLWMAWVFFAGLFGGDNSNEQSQYLADVAALAEDSVQRYEIGGRRVYIVSRGLSTVECLQRNAAFLYDVAPVRPPAEQNEKFIVIYAHEPELGCPLEFVAADELRESKYPLAVEVEWCGGFRDVCRGSLYDLAGRVFANQGGTRNLNIAHYRLAGDQVFISMNLVN